MHVYIRIHSVVCTALTFRMGPSALISWMIIPAGMHKVDDKVSNQPTISAQLGNPSP